MHGNIGVVDHDLKHSAAKRVERIVIDRRCLQGNRQEIPDRT